MSSARNRPEPAKTPAQIRANAATIVTQVADGGRSLDALLVADADDAGRGLTRSLAYGTLRWHPRLLAVLNKLADRPAEALDPEVRALLLVGLFQLLHTDIAVHAAVAESVEAASALKQKKAAGFVNAILRRCQREGARIAAELDRDLATRTAHPPWMAAQLQNDWPQHYERILAANNSHPPLWLRVNRQRIGVEEYASRLSQAGIAFERNDNAPEALRLLAATDVRKLPGFAEGDVSVQDAAAQLAAHMIGAHPGDRVLDACAAPGGKACHVLELQPGIAELVAVDISSARLRKVEENLSRLHLQASLVVGDAGNPAAWWDGRSFQRILLDAPCSATGVIRRHPDIKLLRRPADIDAFAARQADLLERLWPLLASSGRLVYATCSALQKENAEVVAAFLQRHPEAADATQTEANRLAITAQTDMGQMDLGCGRPGLAIPAGEAQMDGFYYACLDKRVA